MTTLAAMNQRTLRAACQLAGISGYAAMTVAAMRTVLAQASGREIDAEYVAPARTLTVTTDPVHRTPGSRTVALEMGGRLNKHHNDDGSITVYSKSVKVFRTLATEGDDAADEDYDPENDVAKFAAKWFGRGKPQLWGRETAGHRWKSKAKLAADAAAADALLTDGAA